MTVARPVRIAVIDSGVQPTHPHILPAGLDPGFGVMRDGSVVTGADSTMDRLGHGTAVMAAIQQWAPMARCTPVRVFDDALRASPRALVTAIGQCVDQGFDLVNLSLGTTNEEHRAVFGMVAEEALDAGVVLIAASDVAGTPCYPGALESVIGVGLDWDCPREFCQPSGVAGACFTASGHPRPIEGVPQRRNLHGVSFAVANVTGFAARALAEAPQMQEGRARLGALRALLGSVAPAIS